LCFSLREIKELLNMSVLENSNREKIRIFAEEKSAEIEKKLEELGQIKMSLDELIISSVIAHAQKIVLQVHCTVVTQNETALKLYERHGFEPYGLEPRALKIGEEFMDEIFLLKKF